jgi:hypothetical protein
MARSTHRWTLALAILATLGSTACNRELQGHADVLMEALDEGDYAKLQTVASASLMSEMSESSFSDIAAIYDQLGGLEDRTRTGFGISDDRRTVEYDLDFAGGDVHLVVVSHSDKLDGFEIEGTGWRRAALNRKRAGLQQLLVVVRTGDRAAVRELVHPSIPDADLDALVAQFSPLGVHAPLVIHDDAIPEFVVQFPGQRLIGSVRLSGSRIVGYSFRPFEAGKRGS